MRAAGASAAAGDAEPRAARHISAGSPSGSAAATSSSSRRLVGQRRRAPQEALLDPARQGRRLGQPEPAGELRGDRPRGSSSSARGLPRVSATIRSRTRASSRPGMAVASSARASASGRPSSAQLRQPRELAPLGGLAHRKHEPHRLGQQASRHEAQDLSRGAVEPLRVVDDAQQRTLRRDLGQERERGQRDEEAVGASPDERPSATRRAARWGSGSADSRPSSGAHS